MKDNNKAKLSGALIGALVLLFLMYLVYGLWSGGFGANSGNMMGFFDITESRQGMIMTVQSIGCVVLSVIVAIYGERLNKLRGLFYGLFILGIGGLLIGTMPLYTSVGSGYILMLIYSLIGGIGYISIDLLVNGAVADVYPDKKTTFLPLIHGMFALGSMIAPLFVSFLAKPEKPGTFAMPYLVLGGVALVASVVFFFIVRKATPETPYADMAPIRARAAANPVEIFKDIRAWQFLFCCFLYHSFQTGMVAWLPRFFEKSFGTRYEVANSMLSLYFFGALCIRFLSPLVLKKIAPKKFFLCSIGASVVIFSLLLLIPPMPITLQKILLVIIGLLQGAAIPTLQILCSDAFPDRTASASSAIGMGISLSTLIAPLAMGIIIEKSGYSASMWFVTALLLLSFIVLLTVKEKKEPACS